MNLMPHAQEPNRTEVTLGIRALSDQVSASVNSIKEVKKRDYFLDNPPMQPKSEIADYAESCLIRVPKRFGSLKEALDSGEEFIIRSEHPYEYSGIGGLLGSFVYDKEAKRKMKELFGDKDIIIVPNDIYCEEGCEWQLFYKLIVLYQRGMIEEQDFMEKMKFTSIKEIIDFSNLTGKTIFEFLGEMSFSFWKLEKGYNRMMVADDSIKGRYHIITRGGKDPCYRNYTIYDKGKIIQDPSTKLKPSLMKQIKDDIAFYERIRCLPRFDNKNCPIIEFQTGFDHNNNFLQIHHGRDSNDVKFELTRKPDKGEIEAEFVRGSTPPEGIIAKITVTDYHNGLDLNIDEDGSSTGAFPNFMFFSLMNKKRKVRIINRFDTVRYAITSGHSKMDEMFCPQLSVIMEHKESLLDSGIIKKLNEIAKKKGIHIGLNFKIVSDGKRCFLKLIDDIEEVIRYYQD